MKYLNFSRNQRGFSIMAMMGGLLFALVAIGSVIALKAYNSSSNSAMELTGFVSKLKATYGFLSGGFSNAMGSVVPASVTYDNSATSGIFNPSIGKVDMQSFPPQLCAPGTASAPDCILVYRGANVKANTIGTAAADYAVVATGLSQAACQQYNQDTYQSKTIPSSGVAASAWRSASVTLTAPSDTATAAVDLTGIAAVYGWDSGCLSTTDGNYVWFGVLLAN